MRLTGRPLTIALSAAVVVVITAGAVSAFSIGRQLPPAAGHPVAGTSSPGASPPNTQPGSATRAPLTPSGSATQRSTTATKPPPAGSQTGNPATTGAPAQVTVQMSPTAQASPHAAGVKTLLATYFTAINQRDYGEWERVVSPGQSAAQTPEQWAYNYSTTVDSNVRVLNINADPLSARLWFTSRQSPELAPKDLPVSCINWDVTYRLTDKDGRLLVDTSDASKTRKAACE